MEAAVNTVAVAIRSGSGLRARNSRSTSSAAILLPSCGLGRVLAVVRRGWSKRRSSAVSTLPRSASLPSLSKHRLPPVWWATSASMTMFAGTGVEGDDFTRLSTGRDDGDVGDAADVERHATAPGVAKEQVIDEGHQGRAAPAGSDVPRAEIGDDGIPVRSAMTEASPIWKVLAILWPRKGTGSPS